MNQVMIITGGSRGIGAATARLAASLKQAAESVDSGAAAAVLERWAAVTTKRARAGIG